MTILFSALATVEYDGQNFYNNEIQASLTRYKQFRNHIICLAHYCQTNHSHNDSIDMNGIEFVFLHKINRLQSVVADKWNNRKLIKEAVSRCDFCIVHVYSLHADTVLKYAKQFNKPCLNVVVGDPWDSFWNYNLAGKIIAPFAYLSLKNMQKKANYSIYVTNHYLQDKYPTKGRSIACSNVDMETGDQNALNNRIAHIDNHNYSRIIIGTLAALDVRYKGQEYVIKAIHELNKKGDHRFEYHLAGGGDSSFLDSMIKKYGLEKDVVIHGAIPHKDVIKFLDEIDIYIQPSKQEGLPRALIEAMSRGCLCYGSKTAGIPELLEKDFIFSKGNYHQIADLLSKTDKTVIRAQAYRNFEEAKLYHRETLNKRRYEFINLFLNR